MSNLPGDWRVDESVRETSTDGRGREFPEYVDDQSTPVTKAYAGYVSPEEETVVVVGEVNHPGKPDDTQLLIYLYEVATGMDKAPFWLFTGGDTIERACEIARQLVMARDQTPYEPTSLSFIPDIRDRVPDLSIHIEFTKDDYRDEWVEKNEVSFELPEQSGHPLEDYLEGYVVGIQFQKYWPCFECQDPDCTSEIEGGNHKSWEMNSSLYVAQSEDGVLIPVGWYCNEHPKNSLDSYMDEILDPDTLAMWDERLTEEAQLIEERVAELEKAGEFDDEEEKQEDNLSDRTGEFRNRWQKSSRARQKLQEEGILSEYSQEEAEERSRARAQLMGPNIDRYYLVRCNIDCMCFGGYYQNLSYIRNPVVVEEKEYGSDQ